MTVQKEIIFELWRVEERRTYYLLSSAGAGVGYALATVSSEITASETRIFLLAISCWALSFAAGLLVIKQLRKIMLLSKKVHSTSAQYGGDVNILQEIDALAKEESDGIVRADGIWKWAQITFLFLGAVLLVFQKVDVFSALQFQIMDTNL